MKNQLEQVSNNKERIVSTLKKIRNSYFSCVYNGLSKNKSIQDIHKDIRKITKVPYSQSMETYALKLAKKIKKQIPSRKEDIDLSLFIYAFYKKNKVYEQTNTIAYDIGKKYETEQKDNVIKYELNYNRNLENPKIFYLASTHSDCAEDHEKYQGKIYVDEKWKEYIKDDDVLLYKIKQYIDKNNIHTFQWVIGKPVWFITRPNCRHYFKALSVNEVLNKNVSILVKKYNMHSQIGRTDTKSYKHPINKEWYTRENIENIIAKYQDRYDYHKSLYEASGHNQEIKKAIDKDVLMIKKWKEYLQKFKK